MIPTIAPVSDAPATGDHVYAERHPDGDTWQAWRAQPGGQPSPIPNVTRVDDAEDAFIVHGDRKPPGSIYGQPQPWQVRCRKDQESQPGLLRGVVED
jgi:hypothetical protein